MTMQHTAVGLILCTGAVLAIVALNFLTQRFAGSRASAQHRRARRLRPEGVRWHPLRAGVRSALANVSDSIRTDPARHARVIGAEKMTA